MVGIAGPVGVDQISIVDSNIVWVNGFDGSGTTPIKASSRTLDGGLTWTASAYTGLGTTVMPSVLTAVNYDTAFAIGYDTVGQTASFWKTIDGGANWAIVAGVLNGGATFADGVRFWNQAQGFAYGDPVSSNWDIYTTSDSGKTWFDVPNANMPAPLSASEYGYNGFDCSATVSGGIGFIGTNLGRVLITTDYGATWAATPTAPYTAAASIKVYASSANYIIVGVLATSASTVYTWKYTSDGGTTWNVLTPTGAFYDYQLCHVPGLPNMFVSSSPDGTTPHDGVSYSTDGGLTWTDYLDATYLQPTGSNIQCLGVGFYNKTTGWVGNYDQGSSINSIAIGSGSFAGFSTISTSPSNFVTL